MHTYLTQTRLLFEVFLLLFFFFFFFFLFFFFFCFFFLNSCNCIYSRGQSFDVNRNVFSLHLLQVLLIHLYSPWTGADILMSTGRPYHFTHLLQVSKKSFRSLILYIFLHEGCSKTFANVMYTPQSPDLPVQNLYETDHYYTLCIIYSRLSLSRPRLSRSENLVPA